MTALEAYVIDASVAVKWFLPEEDQWRAWVVLEEATTTGRLLRAPDSLIVEVANVLWKHHRRGEVPGEEAAEIIEQISFTRLEWTPATELVPRAAEMAMAFGCSVYDSLYLALAEAHDATLITSDRRLCETARKKWPDGRVKLLQDFVP